MTCIQQIPQSCRKEKNQCLSTCQQYYPSTIQHLHRFEQEQARTTAVRVKFLVSHLQWSCLTQQ